MMGSHPLMTNTIASSVANAVGYAYLLAAVLFIFGLKMLTSIKTAQRGNTLSAVGMLIAACATLFLVNQDASADGTYTVSLIWIAAAIATGSAAGLALALKVPMTAMPQMVALLNGFGGIASFFVASAGYLRSSDPSTIPPHELLATGLAVLIGGVTFTGSLVAFAKLQGLVTASPILFVMQKVVNAMLLFASIVLILQLMGWPQQGSVLACVAVLSLVLGVLLCVGLLW